MLTWIEISRENLINNYRVFSSLANPSLVIPIVKSDAYGHGAKQVLEILMAVSPPWIGVHYYHEAKYLREQGYSGRIMVIGQVDPDFFSIAAEEDIDLFLAKFSALKIWAGLEKPPQIHLKFDTGMCRQGFYVEHVEAVAKICASHQSQVVAICSHFSNVEDVLEQDFALAQLTNFRKIQKSFEALGWQLKAHMASSASSLILTQSRFDFSRIGISLYGLWPSQATRLSHLQAHGKLVDLRPVLNWKTRISLLKNVKNDQFIGYGCTYRANQEMKIAVLPVGYFEGYPRLAGNAHSYVLIAGDRCPVVGRVCMNMMMVDVTHLPKVHEGQLVTLLGSDGQESISAEMLSGWAQTIHYELLTRLNAQIPRLIC